MGQHESKWCSGSERVHHDCNVHLKIIWRRYEEMVIISARSRWRVHLRYCEWFSDCQGRLLWCCRIMQTIPRGKYKPRPPRHRKKILQRAVQSNILLVLFLKLPLDLLSYHNPKHMERILSKYASSHTLRSQNPLISRGEVVRGHSCVPGPGSVYDDMKMDVYNY